MRQLFLALPVVLVVGCSAAPVTETDIPVTGTASSGCLNTRPWAYSANRGADIYSENCAYCHQRNGSGQAGGVPALAGNDTLLADPGHGIRMILVTRSPELGSHGMEYDQMVGIFEHLSERDIADVMTYVLSSWGNCAGPVFEDEVRSVAAAIGST